MLNIIIRQAERKIQESKKKVEIYQGINQTGSLDFMILKEESSIRQLENMVQDLTGEMERVAAVAAL